MKVLVTGCAGYIGSRLLQLLAEEKYGHVVGLDNFTYGSEYAIRDTVANTKGRMTIVNDDVFSFNYKAWNPDTIIHLAALVGQPICDKFPVEATRTNYYATEKIVDYVKTYNPNCRVIFPNTNSGYGVGGEETCTEESELRPLSTYARTKCDAEKLILTLNDSVSLRLATVCGYSPRMRFDLLVNDFIKKAYYEGKVELFQPNFRRNYVHIDDVCRTMSEMISRSNKGIYNVCGENFTKLELVHKINEHLPFMPNIVDGEDPDKRDYFVSSEKLWKDCASLRPLFGVDTAVKQLLPYLSLCGKTEVDKMGNY